MGCSCTQKAVRGRGAKSGRTYRQTAIHKGSPKVNQRAVDERVVSGRRAKSGKRVEKGTHVKQSRVVAGKVNGKPANQKAIYGTYRTRGKNGKPVTRTVRQQAIKDGKPAVNQPAINRRIRPIRGRTKVEYDRLPKNGGNPPAPSRSRSSGSSSKKRSTNVYRGTQAEVVRGKITDTRGRTRKANQSAVKGTGLHSGRKYDQKALKSGKTYKGRMPSQRAINEPVVRDMKKYRKAKAKKEGRATTSSGNGSSRRRSRRGTNMGTGNQPGSVFSQVIPANPVMTPSGIRRKGPSGNPPTRSLTTHGEPISAVVPSGRCTSPWRPTAWQQCHADFISRGI